MNLKTAFATAAFVGMAPVAHAFDRGCYEFAHRFDRMAAPRISPMTQ
jgi:hypothetical protein